MNLSIEPHKGRLVRKNTRSWMSTQNSLNFCEVLISQDTSDETSLWIPQWNTLPSEFLSDSTEPKNIFCAYCGIAVNALEQFLGCRFRKTQKIYLAHYQCIQNSPISLSQTLSELKIPQINLIRPTKIQRVLAIGEKEYFIQILATHPLSQFPYFKGEKRLIFNGRSIIWQMNSQNQHICSFEPNIICIPTKQFKLIVNFQELSNKNKDRKKNIKLLIDLAGKEPTDQVMEASWKSIDFDIKAQFTIITKNEEKKKIVDKMNFKYRYDTQNTQPMVKFGRIQIQIRDDNEQQSDQELYQVQPQIENIISQKIWTDYSIELINPQKKQEIVPITFTIEGYETLKDYVCSHAGSKQFQKNILHMKPQEVDEIINQLYHYFPEIIVHEYGNYMFQSLIVACSLPQRLKIIHTLQNQLSELVCNKQGTFSLQQFISFLTHQQEFSAICLSIQSKFIKISMDMQGTHFIRKLIKTFPPHFVLYFSDNILRNFFQMSIDKNAVCVIKALIRVLNNIDEQNLVEVKKKVIQQITLNTDRIIQDQFGNYLIQESYQVFGEDKLKGASQIILEKFSIYSIQKFSSNVVLKCLNEYWLSKEYLQRLKNYLRNNDIVAMFKNKQGNKVLLQIIQKNDQPIQQKIESALWNQEPSRFSTQRWLNVNKRSRTGTVGTNFKNFTQAFNTTNSMRKKYK